MFVSLLALRCACLLFLFGAFNCFSPIYSFANASSVVFNFLQEGTPAVSPTASVDADAPAPSAASVDADAPAPSAGGTGLFDDASVSSFDDDSSTGSSGSGAAPPPLAGAAAARRVSTFTAVLRHGAFTLLTDNTGVRYQGPPLDDEPSHHFKDGQKMPNQFWIQNLTRVNQGNKPDNYAIAVGADGKPDLALKLRSVEQATRYRDILLTRLHNLSADAVKFSMNFSSLPSKMENFRKFSEVAVKVDVQMYWDYVDERLQGVIEQAHADSKAKKQKTDGN